MTTIMLLFAKSVQTQQASCLPWSLLSSGLYRRPWSYTKSADLFSKQKKALAGLLICINLPPVGNYTPP